MKRILTIISIAAAALFCSCNEESVNPYETEEENPVRIISQDLLFEASGGTGQVVFESETPVDVTSELPWCVISTQGNTVTVSVGEYGGLESRYCRIYLTSESDTKIVVAQQKGAWLSLVSGQEFITGDSPAALSVGARSNVNLQVSSDSQWLTGRIEGDSLKIQVGANETGAIREGNVFVSFGSNTRSVKVTQAEVKDLAGEYVMKGLGRTSEPVEDDFSIICVNDTLVCIREKRYSWDMYAVFDQQSLTLAIPNSQMVGRYQYGSTNFYVFNAMFHLGSLTVNYGNPLTNLLKITRDEKNGKTILKYEDSGEWGTYKADGMLFMGFSQYDGTSATGVLRFIDFFGNLTMERI